MSETKEKKGCASSTLFKEFPISSSIAKKNQDTINAFSNIGFIVEKNDSYELTEAGNAAYDPSHSGFCYTEGYRLEDIEITKEASESELPPTLSGAWQVSFSVAPQNVEDWVKDQNILQAASMASIDKISNKQSFSVRMVKKASDEKLIIADPRFSFSPGIHFNMGW